MSMKMILGKAKSGRTTALYDAVLASAAKHKWVLVPEQFVLETEKQLIDHSGKLGIMDIEVLSFRRLSYRVLAELGGVTWTPISEIGQDIIVSNIINDLNAAGELETYAEMEGEVFASEMVHMLSSFMDAAILPSRLQEEGERLQSSDEEHARTASSKLRDVSKIYDRYHRAVDGKYMDSEHLLDFLSRRLSDSALLSVCDLFIDSFDTFSELEKKVLSSLIGHVPHITVSLCMPDVPGLRLTDNIYSFFKDEYRRICRERGLPFEYEECILAESYIHPAILSAAERAALPISSVSSDASVSSVSSDASVSSASSASSVSSCGGHIPPVQIVSASSREEQCRFVSREIAHLIRTRKYHYSDFAVIVPDIQAYLPHIKTYFALEHIAYFVDRNKKITHNPIVSFTMGLLSVLAYPNHSGGYLRTLASGLTPFSPVTIALFQNVCTERRDNISLIRHLQHPSAEKIFQYFESITRGFRTDAEERSSDSASSSSSERERNTCHADSGKKIRLKSFLRTLLPLFDSLRLHQLSEKLPAHENLLKVWSRFIAMWNQIVEISGEEYMSFEQIRDLLERSLPFVEMGILPELQSYVTVGNIKRSKIASKKVLFLLEVNEGVIPAEREEGFFTDEELARMDLPLLPADEDAKQMFDLYEVMTRPSDILYLLYVQEESAKPSIFISNLADTAHRRHAADEPLHEIASLDGIRNALFAAQRTMSDQKYVSPVWAYLIPKFEKNPYGGYLPNTQKVQNEIQTVSITSMEKFAVCPFAHFVDRVLKPQKVEVYAPSPLEFGNIVHKVMEEFAKHLPEYRARLLPEAEEAAVTVDTAALRQIVSDIIRKNEDSLHLSYYLHNKQDEYALKKIERVATASAERLLRHFSKGEFFPRFFETSFEEELHEGVKIRGKIDRVDLYTEEKQTDGSFREYFRVIDYKSSEREIDLEEVESGISFQLMTYLNMFLRKDDSRLAAGAYYYPTVRGNLLEEGETLRDAMHGITVGEEEILARSNAEALGISYLTDGVTPRQNAKVLSRERFRSLMQSSERELEDAVKRMKDGQIDIRPYRGKVSVCEYCEYRGICQFDEAFSNTRIRTLKELIGEREGRKDRKRGVSQ